MKTCKDCRLSLDESCFYAQASNVDRLKGICKTCWKKQTTQYRDANREHLNEVERVRRQTDPEYAARCRASVNAYAKTPQGKIAARESNWRSAGVIGMTCERFDCLLVEQKHTCAGCSAKINQSSHVDHNHAITDRDNVRGLLCQNCNQALGNVRDSVETLQRLIDYLQAHKGLKRE